MRIAIDPGKHSAAWAAVSHVGRIIGGGFAEIKPQKNVDPVAVADALADQVTRFRYERCAPGLTDVVLERPKTRKPAQQKGDQTDIHDLSIVVGACAVKLSTGFGGLSTQVELVFPEEWKGQIPKSVTKARLEKELTREEINAVTWPRGAKRHNVLDAIHLALRHFTKRKV